MSNPNQPATSGVYIELFHGRNNVDEHLEGWGLEGPVLGPFRYVHVTMTSFRTCVPATSSRHLKKKANS
jgi:hypothetical protein